MRLLALTVVEGIELYSNAKGLATRRLGSDCLPFPPEQQLEVRRARGQLDWSADEVDVGADALSQIEFGRVRRLLRTSGREGLASLSDKKLLEAMRLLTGRGRLTYAAVILLGSEDLLRAFVPAYGFTYQYRPSPGSEASYAVREVRSLLAAVESLLELVERRGETRPLNLAGGVQLALPDYPATAVREVVVNALVHRDLPSGGTVDIEHSPERLVIQSPGGLVIGVTPENILTHPSTPRHRLLAESVALLQLAERTGQGIDRAYREMLWVGKQPPSIADDGLRVRASLVGGIGNDAFVRFIRDLPEACRGDVDVLITLETLRGSSTVDANRIAQAIQRTAAEAQEVLSRMADRELALLEPTRRTLSRSFPHYRLRNEPLAALARAVTYRRRTIDQIDEKVIEHVREYGFVTNRTVQRLFDRDIYASRNLLTDLRERGLTGEAWHRSGRSRRQVRAGPRFPGTRRRTDDSATGSDESVSDQLPLEGT